MDSTSSVRPTDAGPLRLECAALGQGRTSSPGSSDIRGVARSIESASCRFQETVAGSNPTLTARIKSIRYKNSQTAACFEQGFKGPSTAGVAETSPSGRRHPLPREMADVVDPNPALKPLSAVVLRIVADHPSNRVGDPSMRVCPTRKDIASSLHDQLNTDLRICPIGRPRRTWRR